MGGGWGDGKVLGVGCVIRADPAQRSETQNRTTRENIILANFGSQFLGILEPTLTFRNLNFQFYILEPKL